MDFIVPEKIWNKKCSPVIISHDDYYDDENDDGDDEDNDDHDASFTLVDLFLGWPGG